MSAGGEGGSGGEKVFDPSPQRLQEARKRGDIPRSADMNAAVSYLALLLVILAAGGVLVAKSGGVLTRFLAEPDRLVGQILGPGGGGVSAGLVGAATLPLLPLFAAPMAAVILCLIAQQSLVFAGEKLEPKLSRLSILANAKQKFGPSGLVEFLKSVVKLCAVSAALGWYLMRDFEEMVGAARRDPRMLATSLVETLVVLLSLTAAIAVVVGAADLLWQRFDHKRRLRMSLQELKEEHKSSEGDTHVKAQRRSRAEAIANNRMLLDVPKADVILVNPTHYAVALKWSRAKGSAPVCVAKGEDAVALRIREVAETAGVPIHRDPPTARALHATVKIGEEIAPEHYRAVAVAIRFADKMRKAARRREGRP